MSAHQEPSADDVAGLLVAASRGEETAWCELVERYTRRVFALVKSRVRRADLAEEVTQSVFATVAAKLGSGGYTEQGRFESWLFRVAMNRARDEMRRAARQAAPMDPVAFSGVEGSERSAGTPGHGADGADLVRLRAAMAELNEEDREVVELRHHGGMSFKQMAEMLGEPVGTLLARHHRALHKLRKALDQSGAGVVE
ncbi:MAG: sigma-70 family RNA polymerase sigma factor [Phycisphaerales bacterium]|nr:sigma-70 family RNA polymerase sigma factor [Phycisphaerales bacterium]